MKQKDVIIGNKKYSVDEFSEEDLIKFKEIFLFWKEMNDRLTEMGGRALNVPDVFSEAIFCIFFNCVRTNAKGNSSWDCYDLNRNKSIQIKSSSIKNDCTSFGPRSEYDELYFMDFFNNNKIDGIIYVYKINFDLKNIILNKRKNETFKKQQEQGRRPRLSLKKEILSKKIKPIKIINLLGENNESA